MATLEVSYECGFEVVIPVALDDESLLLHDPSLADTALMWADTDHAARCETCREEGS